MAGQRECRRSVSLLLPSVILLVTLSVATSSTTTPLNWTEVTPKHRNNQENATSVKDYDLDPVQRLVASLRTGWKTKNVVVYNRIPKSGSTTFQIYINLLSRRLGYKAKHPLHPPFVDCDKRAGGAGPCIHAPLVSDSDERPGTSLASLCGSAGETGGGGCIVDYHFAFVNFSMDGHPNPIYFSIVREPVSRLISSYYYSRYGPREYHKRRRAKKQYGDLSIDQCVDLYLNCSCVGDCTGPAEVKCTRRRCQDLYRSFNTQMLYFCPWGQPTCLNKDRSTLEVAVRTMREQYDVVGVLEEMPKSMKLLETLLPKYFKGLSTLEMAGGVHAKSTTRGKKKQQPPSAETLERLRRLNALDVELYEEALRLLDVRHAAAVTSPARRALARALRKGD